MKSFMIFDTGKSKVKSENFEIAATKNFYWRHHKRVADSEFASKKNSDCHQTNLLRQTWQASKTCIRSHIVKALHCTTDVLTPSFYPKLRVNYDLAFSLAGRQCIAPIWIDVTQYKTSYKSFSYVNPSPKNEVIARHENRPIRNWPYWR